MKCDTMNLWLPKNRKELKKHLSDPLFKNAYFLMLTSMLSLLDFGISLVRFLPECSSVKALDDLDVKVDCVIMAVAHDEFKKLKLDDIRKFMNDKPVLVDVRGMFDEQEVKRKGFYYSRM